MAAIIVPRRGQAIENTVLGNPTKMMKKQPTKKNVIPPSKHVCFNQDIIRNKLRFFTNVVRSFDKINRDGVGDQVKGGLDDWLVDQMTSDIFRGLQLDRLEWEFDSAAKQWRIQHKYDDILLNEPVDAFLDKNGIVDKKGNMAFNMNGDVLKSYEEKGKARLKAIKELFLEGDDDPDAPIEIEVSGGPSIGRKSNENSLVTDEDLDQLRLKKLVNKSGNLSSEEMSLAERLMEKLAESKLALQRHAAAEKAKSGVDKKKKIRATGKKKAEAKTPKTLAEAKSLKQALKLDVEKVASKFKKKAKKDDILVAGAGGKP